jgi:hypothetical protein
MSRGSLRPRRPGAGMTFSSRRWTSVYLGRAICYQIDQQPTAEELTGQSPAPSADGKIAGRRSRVLAQIDPRVMSRGSLRPRRPGAGMTFSSRRWTAVYLGRAICHQINRQPTAEELTGRSPAPSADGKISGRPAESSSRPDRISIRA